MIACEELNGTLGTMYDSSTIRELMYQRKGQAWTGLTINTSDDKEVLQWLSPNSATYTNWVGGVVYEGVMCTTVDMTAPFMWHLNNCSALFPFICEVDTEQPCDFVRTVDSSMTSLNTVYLPDQELSQCWTRCQDNTDLVCRSFGYNPGRSFCEFSASNRWLAPSLFTMNDVEWDYYNKNCFHGLVIEENKELTTSSPNANTTLSATYDTTANATLDTSTESRNPKSDYTVIGDFLCRPVVEIAALVNESTEVREDVKELQDIAIKSKERTRYLSKTSTKDDRASAAYIGSITLIIVASVLAAVVVFDVVTFSRYCKKCWRPRAKNAQIPEIQPNVIYGVRPRPLAERLGKGQATPEVNHISSGAITLVDDDEMVVGPLYLSHHESAQHKLSDLSVYNQYEQSEAHLPHETFRRKFLRTSALLKFIRPPPHSKYMVETEPEDKEQTFLDAILAQTEPSNICEKYELAYGYDFYQ
ncbi:unnamed protein product [Lymnaea stagnalis]|uniref:C-type lectin domain-containing protein n=1 Tax=Lymnaea stagnalis TaxID=6523 RepID=A0AAV2GYQ7_LYMST